MMKVIQSLFSYCFPLPNPRTGPDFALCRMLAHLARIERVKAFPWHTTPSGAAVDNFIFTVATVNLTDAYFLSTGDKVCKCLKSLNNSIKRIKLFNTYASYNGRYVNK